MRYMTNRFRQLGPPRPNDPIPNVVLLDKTLEVIYSARPKWSFLPVKRDFEVMPGLLWAQHTWRTEDTQCGTAMCFAGWTAHLDGAEFDKANPGIVRTEMG